jgi:integrase
LGLRWCDVDFQDGKIHVCETVVEGNNGVCVKGPKSTAGTRTVEVPELLIRALQVYKDKQGTKGKPGAKNAGTQLVFRTQKGKSIAPSNFSRSYRSLRDKLGITDLRLKSFRHGHATILDEVNAPLKVRQERMGHAELDMTMNT